MAPSVKHLCCRQEDLSSNPEAPAIGGRQDPYLQPPSHLSSKHHAKERPGPKGQASLGLSEGVHEVRLHSETLFEPKGAFGRVCEHAGTSGHTHKTLCIYSHLSHVFPELTPVSPESTSASCSQSLPVGTANSSGLVSTQQMLLLYRHAQPKTSTEELGMLCV